ncbi:hypothetical protein BDY17DRAFT_42455 [Neohortaea acidophila]|uniref:Uncharacterized protein n=1 Tax=Neohortaea acidophila TaxID=245834 RepID=A0A6A6PHV8_9PEZI|nr:uncharacterized protein BDY17DRAFT_42455 [Neohortaea acidophila]KAF2479628.1 hypothetical protein BDY17DRAFT_42455 [Neohortaea acidophila]
MMLSAWRSRKRTMHWRRVGNKVQCRGEGVSEWHRPNAVSPHSLRVQQGPRGWSGRDRDETCSKTRRSLQVAVKHRQSQRQEPPTESSQDIPPCLAREQRAPSTQPHHGTLYPTTLRVSLLHHSVLPPRRRRTTHHRPRHPLGPQVHHP